MFDGGWIATAHGRVIAGGNAGSYGSAEHLPLAAPIVGIM